MYERRGTVRNESLQTREEIFVASGVHMQNLLPRKRVVRGTENAGGDLLKRCGIQEHSGKYGVCTKTTAKTDYLLTGVKTRPLLHVSPGRYLAVLRHLV